MRRFVVPTFAVVALLSHGALAQTMLHLSATASVSAAPDELVADLVAQGASPAAATAQRQVNELIAHGMDLAKSAPTVGASAMGYEVYPGPKNAGWVARQTLELRGGEPPALLDLMAKLQAAGFATAALDWRLSAPLRARKQDEATLAALKRMQEQAAAAAAALGLHVDTLKDVRIEAAPVFAPRMMAAAMAAPAAMPPPQATAADQDVSATVSADVALKP